MTTNLDEHRDDYLAEKAAKEAAEKAVKEAAREAEQQKWKAKEDERRKLLIARNSQYLERIAAAVKRLLTTTGSTWSVEHDKEHGTIAIANVKATRWVHISEDQKTISSGTSWRAPKTEGKGTFSIRIGDGFRRGDSERFKQMKDGWHDYDGIARMLLSNVSRIIKETEQRNQRERNEALCETIRKELNLDKWYGPLQVDPSSSKDKPYFVKLRIEQTMTEAEVKAVAQALQQAGIKLGK